MRENLLSLQRQFDAYCAKTLKSAVQTALKSYESHIRNMNYMLIFIKSKNIYVK